MSEFNENATNPTNPTFEDEILQDVSGGATITRTCKCTLCDQTFNMTTTAEYLIIAHLNKVHHLTKQEIIKELNATCRNYVN